jgi:hypothetical protein
VRKFISFVGKEKLWIALAAIVIVATAAVVPWLGRLGTGEAPGLPSGRQAAPTQAASSANLPQPPAAAPEASRREEVFTAQHFGRYAVAVVSPVGAQVQLIDRMAGPGPTDGVAGKRDGRVDVFLGPGQHKAVMTAPAGSTAPVALTVTPFQELNEGVLPKLDNLRIGTTDLGDFQQRSYWLDIPARQTVFIEAAGRHLADLRLWREGSWLVDATPAAEEVEPHPGQKLALRRLVVDLESGLYRVTAYGGPGTIWADGSADKPLHVRVGIPTLPGALSSQFTAGPFGRDRWLVPRSAAFFHLQLPESGTAAIEAVTWTGGQPAIGERATIDKTSRNRSADLSMGASKSDGQYLVTIDREAGARYTLQFHNNLRIQTLKGEGEYLITPVDRGTGEEDVDLTAVLSVPATTKALPSRETPERVLQSSALHLSPASAWKRRFNLLDSVSLYVDVAEPGRYHLASEGVEADFGIVPLMTSPTNKPAPVKPGGGSWELDAGLHVLSITPHDGSRGIMTVVLKGASAPDPVEFAPRLNGALAPVQLEHGTTYNLIVGRTADTGVGAVVRRLPLNFAEGDAVIALPAGGRVHLAAVIPPSGTVGLNAEDGSSLPLEIDAPANGPRRGREISGITVTNPRPQPVLATLSFHPDAVPPDHDLPPLSPQRLAKLPDFPQLAAGQSRFLDLDRQETATFAVKVEHPALYRIESTGRLQTSGNLRTQINPSLARANNNGIGRNFLMQRYLGEGSYWLTVATEGETTGHLGVTLAAAAVRDGGTLEPGSSARISLGSGEGAAYVLDVAEAGQYHIQAQALSSQTAIRLEDAECWPLTTPDQDGSLTRDFQPGRYRVIVLPQAMPARVVTTVERILPPLTYNGHGPHILPLDGQVANRWDEPADGGERVPDVWAFELPAAAKVSLSVSEGMAGEVLRPDGGVVASVSLQRPFAQRLPAGAYRLAVRTIRPNNRFDYTITSATSELTVGRERQVTVPAEIPIAIGQERQVEITSFGPGDVRASLLDSAGTVIAHADDRPDDWNFLIAAKLKPGDYTLKVEAVETEDGDQSDTAQTDDTARSDDSADSDDSAQSDDSADSEAESQSVPLRTTIRLTQQQESADPPLATPGTADIADGALHVVPLSISGTAPLLVATARSRDAVGLVLEQQATDGGWRPVGSTSGRDVRLALARDPALAVAYRLLVWSLDHGKAPITVAARTVAPASVSEKRLAEGVTLSRLDGFDPPLAAAMVDLDGPGLLEIEQASDRLSWSTASDHAVLAHGSRLVAVGGNRLWLLGEDGEKVRAHRVTPDGKAPLALTIGEGERVVLPLTGGERGPLLWIAESRVGQPGVSVGPLDKVVDARRSGVGVGAAVAVLPDAVPARGGGLRLWRADEGLGELPVTLRQIAFAKIESGRLGWGMSDDGAAANVGRDFALPAGAKRLRLALPPGVAAALLVDGQVSRTLWSGEHPATETLETAADHLLLLNTAAQPMRFSALLVPASDGQALPSLTPGTLAKQWQPEAGVVRFELARGEQQGARPLTLSLSAAADEALLVQKDGIVRRGRVLSITDDATVLLHHGPGLAAAWLDGADSAAWPIAAEATAASDSTALSGPEMRAAFTAAAPTLLHLATDTPVVSGVRRPGANPEVGIWPQGAGLHLFLPTGTTIVGLRPLAGNSLSGSMVSTRSEPVAIGEGLGAPVRLAPGDARLFAFTVGQAGPIGIGVRGSADSARLRLLDDAGTVLAEGAVAMKVLPAGRYYLLAENRMDAAAVEIRPALVGVERPDTGPPQDVKRSYWQLVGGQEDK